jgi:hypothetical protein
MLIPRKKDFALRQEATCLKQKSLTDFSDRLL